MSTGYYHWDILGTHLYLSRVSDSCPDRAALMSGNMDTGGVTLKAVVNSYLIRLRVLGPVSRRDQGSSRPVSSTDWSLRDGRADGRRLNHLGPCTDPHFDPFDWPSTVTARATTSVLAIPPRLRDCKDGKRRGHIVTNGFDFLGYTFRARSCNGKRRILTSFDPENQ